LQSELQTPNSFYKSSTCPCMHALRWCNDAHVSLVLTLLARTVDGLAWPCYHARSLSTYAMRGDKAGNRERIGSAQGCPVLLGAALTGRTLLAHVRFWHVSHVGTRVALTGRVVGFVRSRACRRHLLHRALPCERRRPGVAVCGGAGRAGHRRDLRGQEQRHAGWPAHGGCAFGGGHPQTVHCTLSLAPACAVRSSIVHTRLVHRCLALCTPDLFTGTLLYAHQTCSQVPCSMHTHTRTRTRFQVFHTERSCNPVLHVNRQSDLEVLSVYDKECLEVGAYRLWRVSGKLRRAISNVVETPWFG